MAGLGSREMVGSESGSALPKPVAAQGPETVVSPGRRDRAAVALQERPAGTSEVWRRLFPPDPDVFQGTDTSPSGIELGHFVIEERIGIGGMGGVFRAIDTRLQRVVALKVLSPAQACDPASVQRFQNEGRAAARLDHDNIARVYYIGEENGLSFIAFEFVTGTNVRDLIHDRRRLEPAEAVNYTLQIASALRHTSAASVIHRDIKPSNIIITPSGRAKLVDLGLARKVDTQSAPDLTVAGTTLGTFDYISPEQAKDPRNVDVRSDIYSLGCTLYHMLTGEPPYPDGTVLQKLLNHQGKEPPDPAQKCSAVSPALSAIVGKMMASDPKERYASPDQLIHDLMVVAGTLGLQGLHPEGLVWVSPNVLKRRFWERHAGWLAAATVLVLIVFLLDKFPQIGGGIPANDVSHSPFASSPLGKESPREILRSPDSTDNAMPPELASIPPSQETVSTMRDPGALDSPRTEAPVTDADRPEVVVPPAPAVVHGPPKSRNVTSPATIATLTRPEEIFGGELERRPITPDFAPPESSPPDASEGSRMTDENPAGLVSTNPLTPAETDGGSLSHPGPRMSAAGADAVEDQTPVWIIDSTGSLVKKYPTLEAACAEVQDGRIIELRFNGPRREKPIRVNSKNVTLRAARGYRPVIELIPPEVFADGGPIRLLSVIGGRLELNNLALHVSVPEASDAEELTVLSAEQSANVRLRGVAVTVENPERRRVAVFELARNAVETNPMLRAGVPHETPTFEMTNCFFRGQADLFVSRHAGEFRWILQNAAIALEGSLLRLSGDSSAMEPVETASVELRLEHVTCLLGSHLLEMSGGFLPWQLPAVSIEARNSIFATTNDVALIVTHGDIGDEEFRKLLTWSGERNYFDQYQVFWTFASGTEVNTLEHWRETWGASNSIGPNNEGVAWKTPSEHEDLSRMRRSDFELDPDFAMSATATDGSDVGADLSGLPSVPEEVVSTPNE